MLAADRTSRIVAAHPLTNARGEPLLSRAQSIADREYFQQPLATGKSFISDVFRGRGFGQDPIVAMSSPVRGRAGEALGIVEGSLRLTRFERLVPEHPETKGVTVLLLDSRDRRPSDSTSPS